MDHDAILSRLCGLGAPSGFEGPASRAAAELLRPLADEVTVDRMGSVLALRRCGREGAKRLLLTPIWTRSALWSPAMKKGI